jgi:ribonuclease VapC
VIVVDTSALVAIALREPTADACRRAMADSPELLVSAGTFAEALIVAGRRGIGDEMAELVDRVGLRIVPVTEHRARLAAQAYSRFGKGAHGARLNLGDCFAYALAREEGCPLLFVGDDFAKTDVTSAL